MKRKGRKNTLTNSHCSSIIEDFLSHGVIIHIRSYLLLNIDEQQIIDSVKVTKLKRHLERMSGAMFNSEEAKQIGLNIVKINIFLNERIAR